jgi:hypothetical protein
MKRNSTLAKPDDSMESPSKRPYTRRSEEERIAELNSRIEKIKQRLEMKQRKDSPVLREMAKLQRMLRKFAQTALDHGRSDLANSTQAFAAGLDRSLGVSLEPPQRRGRPPKLL